MGGVDVGGGDEVDVLEDEVDEAVHEFGCYLVCLVFGREGFVSVLFSF